MKKADILEFQEHSPRYLFGVDSVEVTCQGRTIGYFIPVKPRNDQEMRQAMARLQEAVERVLEETGMTEDELVLALAGPDA